MWMGVCCCHQQWCISLLACASGAETELTCLRRGSSSGRLHFVLGCASCLMSELPHVSMCCVPVCLPDRPTLCDVPCYAWRCGNVCRLHMLRNNATHHITLLGAGAAFGAAGQRCMAISAAVFLGGMDKWRQPLIDAAKSLKVRKEAYKLCGPHL